MEAKKIEVVKNWLELKLVRNIQILLGFTNFYQQFIQSFNKIAIPLISILKTTGLPNKLAFSKNNGSKSASSKNNNNMPASERNNGNSEVDRFGIGENCVKHAKKSRKLSKSGKLFKSGKSKSEKTSKSQNLAKLGKKMSKSGNLTNFNAIKVGPKFLTPNARTAFNLLWVAFIEAPILRYFDPECHIWIKTDALGYAMNEVLSQRTSKTNLNGGSY